MNRKLRDDAERIWTQAIRAVLPDEAVERALQGVSFPGRVFLVAAGKAAWQMANAALRCLPRPVDGGIVITKEGHVRGELPSPVVCHEGGHPVPDARSFRATEEALELLACAHLQETDTVLFLLSGGGSALFEKPTVPAETLLDVTRQLLACGADIVEMNTIRKRFSAVKGGRFAQFCEPARIFQIVLSDIVGDPLDLIASGPACPDQTTCQQAREIATRYRLNLPDCAWDRLREEPPKALPNVRTKITGSVHGTRLRTDPADGLPDLPSAGGGRVPRLRPTYPRARRQTPGVSGRGRDCGAPDGNGEGGAESGTRARRRAGNRGHVECGGLQCGQ